MHSDFHYYATYAAAYLAGYNHEESLDIAYSAQFVDCCTQTLLEKIDGPKEAATTQSQMELMNARTDFLGIQRITRIWASFHFLPYDLRANLPKKHGKRYMNKYRLICKPNGSLLEDTVNLAKGKSLQSVGIAMHILADTWAHAYFAGTPSQVINNTNYYFYELISLEGEEVQKKISFRHNPKAPDDIEKRIFTNSLHQEKENSIMNLGHGRAGRLPDYSYIRYKYMPAWGDYELAIKDNPAEYFLAFRQMVYAMKYLKGAHLVFEKDRYDEESVLPWEKEIMTILTKRQLLTSEDWKAFGEKLSGKVIEDFDLNKYQEAYLQAKEEEKNQTFLGNFFLGAMAQKSMVTNKIFNSGNPLAGVSIDYKKLGFRGIRDYKKLIEWERGEKHDEKKKSP